MLATPVTNNKLQCVAIPSLKDNYTWLVHHSELKQCIVVDPGETSPVLDYLSIHKTELVAILVTHHHRDHTDGIQGLIQHFPKLTVYNSALERTRDTALTLSEGDKLSLLNGEFVCTIYAVPGHTLGHIAYYVEKLGEKPAVFTGDTLFSGGCGRLLGGTVQQLYHSLLRLREMPSDTQVYCGHEYTVDNLMFAAWLEPYHTTLKAYLDLARQCVARRAPTLPSSLKAERTINPFLRCDENFFIESMRERFHYLGVLTPLALFSYLRGAKDRWRSA